MALLRSGEYEYRGVSVGVYPTSAPDQVAYVVGHSESQVLFIENEEQVDKVLQILPNLQVKQVIIWDPKGLWGFSQNGLSSSTNSLKGPKPTWKKIPTV